MDENGSQVAIDLLLRLRQNDEQALACLMNKFYTDLYNYAARFTTDDALIKDCIQEVFISIWQRRETASEILSPKFYLLRAVKNKVLKSLDRLNRKSDVPIEEYNFLQEFSIEKFIIEKQISEEKAEKLRRTLTGLSRRQNEIIHLKFYQHLDHAQIADLMNISRQSVYNLLHETIQRLRNLWHNEFVTR
jgi:RNA polymerase sigma factor (sigma-70 family)